MEKFTGFFYGIVIQNNDPNHAGRCKVYIPHVAAAIMGDWYNQKQNKSFKFPGANLDSDLEAIIDDLKEVLPWAENAGPIVGGNATGRYNAALQIGTISDSNKIQTITPQQDYQITDYSLNKDGIGEKPARRYEIHNFKVKDAFTDATADNEHTRINKYAHNYTPSSYSNLPKGSFGIPNVGSHVWCFFIDGDPMSPVFFASSFGQEDWKAIYEYNEDNGYDYPGAYENINKTDSLAFDHNNATYRNKYVLNQKGGTIEIINTDNKETLKFTHFSGSFSEFNNHVNIEFAVENKQTLVQRDQFFTVKGHDSKFIGRNKDLIIKGNRFIKVGAVNEAAEQLTRQWRQLMTGIADKKQLFEIKRAQAIAGGILPKTSSLQSKSGSPAPCPCCGSSSTRLDNLYSLRNTWTQVGIPQVTSTTNGPGLLNTIVYGDISAPSSTSGAQNGQVFGSICPVCGGSALSPSSMDGQWSIESLKAQITKDIEAITPDLADLEAQLEFGGNDIIHIGKHKMETIGLVMNDFGSIRVDMAGKMFKNRLTVGSQGVFENRKESPLIEHVHVDSLPSGDYTLNVCNKYNVQVGAGGISFKSFGPVQIGGTITTIAGDQVNVSSEHEVNIHGGKRLNLVADILTLRQTNREQVLVDSSLGVSRNLIVGGGLMTEGELFMHHMTAPVEINETEQTTVFAKLLEGLSFNFTMTTEVEGGGGVAQISGGTHIDAADSSDNHNTWSNATVSINKGNITLLADSNDDKVRCYPHSHHMKTPPWKLVKTNDEVRQLAKATNSKNRVPALQRQNVNAANKVQPVVVDTTT